MRVQSSSASLLSSLHSTESYINVLHPPSLPGPSQFSPSTAHLDDFRLPHNMSYNSTVWFIGSQPQPTSFDEDIISTGGFVGWPAHWSATTLIPYRHLVSRSPRPHTFQWVRQQIRSSITAPSYLQGGFVSRSVRQSLRPHTC
jgi:hypothetical protein